MTKHIHHDLISEWISNPSAYTVEMMCSDSSLWRPIKNPLWDPAVKYRLIPIPQKKYFYYTPTSSSWSQTNKKADEWCWKLSFDVDEYGYPIKGSFSMEYNLPNEDSSTQTLF